MIKEFLATSQFGTSLECQYHSIFISLAYLGCQRSLWVSKLSVPTAQLPRAQPCWWYEPSQWSCHPPTSAWTWCKEHQSLGFFHEISFNGHFHSISPQNMASYGTVTYLHFRILEISHWFMTVPFQVFPTDLRPSTFAKPSEASEARSPTLGSFTVPTNRKLWDASFPATEKTQRDSWVSGSSWRMGKKLSKKKKQKA